MRTSLVYLELSVCEPTGTSILALAGRGAARRAAPLWRPYGFTAAPPPRAPRHPHMAIPQNNSNGPCATPNPPQRRYLYSVLERGNLPASQPLGERRRVGWSRRCPLPAQTPPQQPPPSAVELEFAHDYVLHLDLRDVVDNVLVVEESRPRLAALRSNSSR